MILIQNLIESTDSVHPVITGMGVSVSVKIFDFFPPMKIQATCKCMERVIVEAKHASLTLLRSLGQSVF